MKIRCIKRFVLVSGRGYIAADQSRNNGSLSKLGPTKTGKHWYGRTPAAVGCDGVCEEVSSIQKISRKRQELRPSLLL